MLAPITFCRTLSDELYTFSKAILLNYIFEIEPQFIGNTLTIPRRSTEIGSHGDILSFQVSDVYNSFAEGKPKCFYKISVIQAKL